MPNTVVFKVVTMKDLLALISVQPLGNIARGFGGILCQLAANRLLCMAEIIDFLIDHNGQSSRVTASRASYSGMVDDGLVDVATLHKQYITWVLKMVSVEHQHSKPSITSLQ